jgi:hypothetical protein
LLHRCPYRGPYVETPDNLSEVSKRTFEVVTICSMLSILSFIADVHNEMLSSCILVSLGYMVFRRPRKTNYFKIHLNGQIYSGDWILAMRLMQDNPKVFITIWGSISQLEWAYNHLLNEQQNSLECFRVFNDPKNHCIYLQGY